MNKREFKVGSHCVVRKDLETVVFRIESIHNGIASLSYMSGVARVSGGEFPVCGLSHPSKAQLRKAGLLPNVGDYCG